MTEIITEWKTSTVAVTAAIILRTAGEFNLIWLPCLAWLASTLWISFGFVIGEPVPQWAVTSTLTLVDPLLSPFQWPSHPSPIPHHNQTPPEDLHWANRRSHQKRRKGCNVRLIQKTKSNVCWIFWEIEVHDLGWFRVAVTLFVPPNEPPVQCWPWLRHEHFYWLRNAQVWQWDTQQGEASLGKMWSSISSVETKHMLYCVSLAH